MAMRGSEEPAIRAEDAKGKFAEALNRASKDKERVVVTRRGKPIAVVMPMRDARLLDELEDRMDAEDLRAALAEWARTGRKSKPLGKVLRDLGIKP